MVYYGTVRVDKQGRVTLPAEARGELKIQQGDFLHVGTVGKEIRLNRANKP